jgi:glutaredoxin
MITLYTLPNCFKCGRVKNKLRDLDLEFEEVICDSEKLAEVMKRSESLSMPVMFDGDKELNVQEYLDKE